MFYPREFIRKVKKAYPNWKEVHRKLDEGDASVSRHLYNGANRVFTIDEILAAKSLKELQEEARESKQRIKLYEEWCKLLHKDK